jgi:hypothetical protein
MTDSPQNFSQGDAMIIQPSFALQRKLGGAAGRVLSPLAVKRAETALEMVIPPVSDEVMRLLSELEDAVGQNQAGSRDVIWKNAHEMRGLAGTAGKRSLGLAADAMCRYLNGSDANFKADRNVLATIATVAKQALKDGADEDPMVKMLLIDCSRAVTVQRKREGRSEGD